MSGLGPRR